MTIPSDGDSRQVSSVNPAFQRALDHIALLWAGAFTGTGAGPGLQGTGGSTSGDGVKGIGGALNLSNQSALGRTGLLSGDLFWDGTNLRFCKTNGASVIVI